MSPRGRERMDIKSYNQMRRKQALIRQQSHWAEMAKRTEERLTWVKNRQFEVQTELKTLQNVIYQGSS